MALTGVRGRPFIDMERYVDTGTFAALDQEICLGLAQVAVSYTGGSHKTMNIVPPSLKDEPYIDYGHVLAKMNDDELARFVSLADNPKDYDLARLREYQFGEERDHPL